MNLLVWVVFFLILSVFVMTGLYMLLVVGCAVMAVISKLCGLEEEIEEEIEEEVEEEIEEETTKEVIVILNPDNNICIGLKH